MPPPVVRIGLLGCGVVGQGFLTLLGQRERLIRESVGAPLKLSRVAVRNPGKSRGVDLSGAHIESDPLSVAKAEDVDLLVELCGGESMLEPVRFALRRGVPVVTANKSLLALPGDELGRPPAGSNTTIPSEASPGGGTPAPPAAGPGPPPETCDLPA